MTASAKKLPLVPLALVGAAGVALWFFPLFRVMPLHTPATTPTARADQPVVFDPVAVAGKIWRTDFPAAAPRATELKILAPAIRANAETARTTLAKSSGLGAAYFFLRGSGKVIAREKNLLRIAPIGAESEVIVIRLGPVFGNTVRDGCGLLDVNNFPGLQEFNSLSAELNALVEKTVLPGLRDQAVVGATVEFVGCAEAPENAPDTGEPLLTLVPIQATLR